MGPPAVSSRKLRARRRRVGMPRVFISYSHRDADWKEELAVHLRGLEKAGHLEVWDDTQLGAGEVWKKKIKRAVDSSDAAVLLVTKYFLASDFIQGTEVPRILRRMDRNRVFPLIVRPCLWKQHAWLAKMQVRPQGGQALTAGSDHDIEHDLTELALEVYNRLRSHDDPKAQRKVGSRKKKARKRGRRLQRIRVVSLGAGIKNWRGMLERMDKAQSYFKFLPSTARLPGRAVGKIEGSKNLKIYRLPKPFYRKIAKPKDDLALCMTKYPVAFEEEDLLYFNYLGATSPIDDRVTFVSLKDLSRHAKKARVKLRTALGYVLASHLAYAVGGRDYHEKLRKCPMDFTEDQNDVVKGLRKGGFCARCLKALGKKRRLTEALADLLELGR